MCPVHIADEEAEKGPALLRPMIADGSGQRRVSGLQRIEDGPLRDRPSNFQLYFSRDTRQVAEVLW